MNQTKFSCVVVLLMVGCSSGEGPTTIDTDNDGVADNEDCSPEDASLAVEIAQNVCGDGVACIAAGETCDDGFTDACGTCNVDCSGPGTASTCGDDVLCPETEVCDDGYNDACGSCNTDCSGVGTGTGQVPVCV